MSTPVITTCPNCGHKFNIENVLAVQIEQRLKAEMSVREEEVRRKMEELQEMRKTEQERLVKKLEEEKVKQLEAVKKEQADKQAVEIKLIQETVSRQNEQLEQFRNKELEMLKKEQLMRQKQQEMELDMQKRLLEGRKEIEEHVRKLEQERNDMRVKELEKQLDDQKRLIMEMQRKADQGSMQLQGEVQELALEEILRGSFPFDLIEEVAKGVRGADVVQTIRNNMGNVCGSIIYESKRTKAFSEEWIDKLKSDMRSQQADLAILVTQTMPKDMERFGQRDGVWICSFAEVKSLAFVLRDGLIRISASLKSQENRGEKMAMLYEYLTGTEFRNALEAIVEGFVSMKDAISKERIQMEKIWKEREKQLDKVLINTSGLYGSIRGIAGSSVMEIKLLEE